MTSAAIFLPNPCEQVRTTCRQWMEEEPFVGHWLGATSATNPTPSTAGRRSVKIHPEHIPRLAQDILERKRSSPTWIEWDEEKWHYSGDSYCGSLAQKKERIAMYILALDAINFCFWPPRSDQSKHEINPLEYDHLAVALKHLAETDDDHQKQPGDDGTGEGGGGDHSNNNNIQSSSIVQSEATYAFSPSKLAQMTPEKMQALLEPYLKGQELDNIATRAHLWKELGTSLLEHFHGSATCLLAASENNAPQLVKLMTSHFPGFRDATVTEDATGSSSDPSSKVFFFLKRAQIFVGDVNAALKLGLSGMDQLTTFADYRVPQILRHFEILEYAPESLACQVDEGREILAGSYDELSIRAATVVAVEDLVEYLNSQCHPLPDDSSAPSDAASTITTGESAKGTPFFTAMGVDWYLWQVGERMHQQGAMKPFHKVRTTFY
jgi:hypothetical protein